MNKLNKTQVSKLNSFQTTSAKIRYLNYLGWSNSEIKNELKIIYQFVRNVLKMDVKNPKENFKI